MPSVSDKQQKFFKWVQSVQNGTAKKKDAPKCVIDAAKSMIAVEEHIHRLADIVEAYDGYIPLGGDGLEEGLHRMLLVVLQPLLHELRAEHLREVGGFHTA